MGKVESKRAVRPWRRTLKRIFLGLIVVALVVRVTLRFWLPAMLDKAVSGHGISLTYANLDLSLIEGRLDLFGVELAPAAGETEGAGADDEALTRLAYLGFDLDVSALFTGVLRVHRLEVEGLSAYIERDALGTWNLDRHLARIAAISNEDPATSNPSNESAPAGTPDVTPDATSEAQPLDFRLPLELKSLTVRGVRVHLVDAFVTPPLDTHLDFDLALSHRDGLRQSLELRISAWAPELLEALHLELRAEVDERFLDLEFSADVAGIGSARLAPYLEPLGVRPHARRLDFGLRGGARLRPLAGSDVELEGAGHIDRISLRADLEPELVLDRIGFDVRTASNAQLSLSEVLVRGMRGRAQRLTDGTLRIAGLDLVSAAGHPDIESAASEDVNEDAATPSTFVINVARFAVEEGHFTFRDAAVEPPVTLELAFGAEVNDLVLDPKAPGQPCAIDGFLDLASGGRLEVAGSAVPTGSTPELQLRLSGRELSGSILRAHLAELGLTSELRSGTLEATLEARMRGDQTREMSLALTDIGLRDDGQQLLEIDGLHVTARVEEGGPTTLALLRLDALRFPVALGADDTLTALGVRTIHPAATLGVVSTDQKADDIVRLYPRVDFELKDLVLGASSPSPATLAMSFQAEGLADSLAFGGTLLSRPGTFDLEADLALAGRGLRMVAVQQLLERYGIESTLGGADLTAKLTGRVEAENDGIEAHAEFTEIVFRDGTRELLALGAARLEDLSLNALGLHAGRVTVEAPRFHLSRGADGAIELLGLRMTGAPPRALPPERLNALPTSKGTGSPPDSSSGSSPRSMDAPFLLKLEDFELEDLTVQWTDELLDPPVETRFTLSAKSHGLSTAADAPAATLEVRAQLEGTLDEFLLQGSASLDPRNLALEARLDLSGLRAGPLAAYLPPGVESRFTDGRMHALFSATAVPAAEGGEEVRVVLSELELHTGPEQAPVLELEACRLHAPRLDASAGHFDVEQVALEGLELSARKTSEDTVELLGLAWPIKRAHASDAARPDQALPSTEDEDTRSASLGSSLSVAVPPFVRLGALQLGIQRLRYQDETLPGSEPLDLSLALVLDGPQILCSPEPEDLPAIAWRIEGAATPLIGALEARFRATPFEADPVVSLEFALHDIQGWALERTLPEVAQALDASAYQGGEFSAEVEAVFHLARRGPIDFELGRGFGAEISVVDVALRTAPEAEVVAGFERLDIDLKRMRPSTGETHIRSLELFGTRARVTQEAGGLRVAGVLLRAREDAGSDSAEPVVDPDIDLPETQSRAPRVVARSESGEPVSEFRIDRISVSGLDFEYSDTTTEPALFVPIRDLQLEVQRFTTRAFEEPLPITFRALVDAGDIQLPERSSADNLVSGIFSSVAGAVAGADDEHALEDRPLWDLFEVQGQLEFVPALTGRVDLELLGLELPAFAGPASGGGVEIGDGLFDMLLDLRFRKDGGIAVATETSFTMLSLSEPSDGPISTYLRLPAPLDTVLFLLRDETGKQTIPLRLDIGPDGVSGGAVAAQASLILAGIIGDALAAAPLRFVGPLADLLDVAGFGAEPLSGDTIEILFQAGAAIAGVAELSALEPIAEALRTRPDYRVVIQHDFGVGDLTSAERLANPAPEVTLALFTHLRERRLDLDRRWRAQADLARAHYAVGLAAEARAGSERLRAIESERATLEAGIDRLADHLRPGAERRASQRTRRAALSLAELRLERLLAHLLARSGRAALQRVDIRRPQWKPGEERELGRVTITPKL